MESNKSKWIRFWIYAGLMSLWCGVVFYVWNQCFTHDRLSGSWYIIAVLTLNLIDCVKSIITGKKVVWNE